MTTPSSAPAQPPADSAPLAQSVELRQGFIRALPEKVAAVEALGNRLVQGGWRREVVDELSMRMRSLSSGGVTFGLPEVAAASRRLEQMISTLRARGVLDPGSREPIARLIRDFSKVARDTLRSESAALPVAADVEASVPESLMTTQAILTKEPSGPRRPLILLAEEERELAALLALNLGRMGYDVHAFDDLALLAAAVPERAPVAVVSGIALPEGESAGLKALRLLKAETGIPLVFISQRAELSARIRALRAGADAFLAKPLDIGALAGALHELVDDLGANPYRVLVVDEAPDSALMLAQVLEAGGVRCETLSNPQAVLRPLHEFQPEVILTDLHMLSLNGFELARLVRQEGAFVNIPIFHLSDNAGDADSLESIAAGADHFLPKPVPPERLIAAVTSRARRARVASRRMEYLARRDAATGVYNSANFAQELERALLNAAPIPGALVCVLIDDYLTLRNALSGQEMNGFVAAVAEAIRGHTAVGDIVGRHNDLSFQIYLCRTSQGEIDLFAKNLGAALAGLAFSVGGREVRSTYSIGVQTAGEQSVAALIEGAAQAAARAHQAGGDQVRLDAEDPNRIALKDREQRYVALLTDREQNWERFQLAYQPLVAVGADQQSHVEALLRVRDGQGGQYPVAEVVETATRLGITDQIDRRVLGLALFNLIKGPMHRTDDVLMVKLSAGAVNSEALFKALTAKLDATGIGPRLAFLFPHVDGSADLDLFVRRVDQLKATGAKVGIERFGRDASDLQVLDRMKIDYVKLDRGLIEGLGGGKGVEARFQKVLNATRGRGAKVIAGFVENSSTLAYLWTTAVDFVQGNMMQPAGEELLSHPVTLGAEPPRR